MYIDAEQLQMMKRILGDDVPDSGNDELLSYYLEAAYTRIMNRRFPFGWTSGTQMPNQYKPVQLEIAVYLFNKRGAEGESLHSENGISRSYGITTDVPEGLMSQVTPKGRVL